MTLKEQVEQLTKERDEARAELERLRVLADGQRERAENAEKVRDVLKKFYSPEAAASLRSELAQSRAIVALREHERDEARAENKRLQATLEEIRELLLEEGDCDCPPEWPRCVECRIRLKIQVALKGVGP
jgi:multidrug resistance efflux pump